MATIYAPVRDLAMGLGKKIKDYHRNRLSYKQKLFLPIAAMLWVLVFLFAVFQARREVEFKRGFLISQVDLINKRIIDLYENNEDLKPFVNFIDDYFDASVLEEISVAVFDNTSGDVISDMGFPAPLPDGIDFEKGSVSGAVLSRDKADLDLDPSRTFYYKEETSPDGKILVQTIMPFNEKVAKEVSIGIGWWVLIFIFGVALTVVIYITISHVARNVRTLNKFASQAVSNVPLDDFSGFGNDDLGQIGRKILDIYNSRRAAQQSREIEHNVALKATEERALLRRQVTNNISHELKTPVGVIRGYIDTIIENPDMDEASRIHFLSKTQAHVERLCNLLNDLSTMTRLDEGSANIKMESLDFRALLDGVANDIEESGIGGGMRFVIDVPPGTMVKGNSALLVGAIMNLVKNAVNYSRGTEMGVKIMTHNLRNITFVFYDNGTGVEAEHIPHLFDRFYRVDKGRSRKAGGTGLGLPIVKSSINAMEGSITVRNAAKGGLEFVFALRVGTPAQSISRTTDNSSDSPASSDS